MKISELMEDALLPGMVLVRHSVWGSSKWFAPYFSYNDYPRGRMWAGLDEEGIRADYPEEGDQWELWEPKKQPVVRWKWAWCFDRSKDWIESGSFYTEEEFHRVMGKTDQHKKLEYTKTEFPS